MTKNNIPKKIYLKIENEMRKKEMTLTELSKKSGIADSTLCSQLKKLEKGNYIPIKSLKLFEKYLGIELIFFKV